MSTNGLLSRDLQKIPSIEITIYGETVRMDVLQIIGVLYFQGLLGKKMKLTNSYYLHLFSKKQPDLNWEHEPLRDGCVR